ncbi:glutamine amidotransferase [Bacillus sp. N9]
MIGKYYEGKTAAFASDCSPHWGSLEFLNWEYYSEFWANVVRHLKR